MKLLRNGLWEVTPCGLVLHYALKKDSALSSETPVLVYQLFLQWNSWTVIFIGFHPSAVFSCRRSRTR